MSDTGTRSLDDLDTEALAHGDSGRRRSADRIMPIQSQPCSRRRSRFRGDGACVHLGDGGCSIYEHRPATCRRYDCRIFSLFGTGDNVEGGRYTPAWIFRPQGRHGRVLVAAYQVAGVQAVSA